MTDRRRGLELAAQQVLEGQGAKVSLSLADQTDNILGKKANF